MSKDYNCPDCSIITDSCDGCPRVKVNITDTIPRLNYGNIPDVCKHCATHPSNGGSGICLCTLGCYHITC